MSKILLFALVAVAAYLFFRIYKSRPRPGRPDPAAESMVACARCGVHVPRSEAIETTGRFFCSEEHRALGPG